MSEHSELRIVVRMLTDADRTHISEWHYPGELSIYDPGRGAASLQAPDHVALTSPDGRLVGYGTLGPEAQVPGGDYGERLDVVDLGVGLRPDLMGRGYGVDALRALMDHARLRLAPGWFRVTVASANGRATALVARAGFQPTHRFERPSDAREFVTYEQNATHHVRSS